MRSSAEWHFEPEGPATRVRVIAAYDIPVPRVVTGLRRRIEAEIDRMTEASLRELKRLVEKEIAGNDS